MVNVKGLFAAPTIAISLDYLGALEDNYIASLDRNLVLNDDLNRTKAALRDAEAKVKELHETNEKLRETNRTLLSGHSQVLRRILNQIRRGRAVHFLPSLRFGLFTVQVREMKRPYRAAQVAISTVQIEQAIHGDAIVGYHIDNESARIDKSAF